MRLNRTFVDIKTSALWLHLEAFMLQSTLHCVLSYLKTPFLNYSSPCKSLSLLIYVL